MGKDFDLVLSRVAESEWRHAVDPTTGRPYLYNTKTKETRWLEADSITRVSEFLKRQGIQVKHEEEGIEL